MIYGLLIDLKQSLNFLYELEIAQIFLAKKFQSVRKFVLRTEEVRVDGSQRGRCSKVDGLLGRSGNWTFRRAKVDGLGRK